MIDTMRTRFESVVLDLLRTDTETVVVLASIGAASFWNLPESLKSRVVDVGIREQAMIGVTGGLALEGFKPIAMSYAPFLVERPFEQIKLSLGHQDVNATLVSVGGSWDASGSGRTHQAPEDVAVMATLPGWTIHVPGHPDEAESAIRRAHASEGSHYIRLTNDQNTSPNVTNGGLVTLRRGSDNAMTVLGVGPLVDEVIAATADMDVTILYSNVPVPIDERSLSASVTGNHLVLIEPYLAGTSVSQVTRALSDRPMMIDFVGVTNPELRMYGTPSDLRAAHGLDAVGIRRRLDDIRQLKMTAG